jgi:hypothetical protein
MAKKMISMKEKIIMVLKMRVAHHRRASKLRIKIIHTEIPHVWF